MDEKRTGELQPEREAVERDRGEPAAPSDFEEAGEDDFAARNVTMTNAFPGGASPYAGALIGKDDKFLEPTTDEERVDEDVEAESRVPRAAMPEEPADRG